jgi:hypothetical protein
MPPHLRALPEGCSFAPRCRLSEDRCSASIPPEFAPTPETIARCLRVTGREINLGGLTQRAQHIQPARVILFIGC